MQNVSELWKDIMLSPNHYVETMVKIDGEEFGESKLCTLKTTAGIFPGEDPEVGGCVARKIKLTVLKPQHKIPEMARVEPFNRVTDGERVSEWIPKGKFNIDTRSEEDVNAQSDGLTIEGFCDMLLAEVDCPIAGLDWPAKDIDVVRLIAKDLGVELDQRTLDAITRGYDIQIPTNYSSREVLSGIAAMYGGAFIFSDEGKLLLITLDGMPKETYYLIRNNGDPITFGGVRILV